jgi:putative SOS response-associated peptidase YedK
MCTLYSLPYKDGFLIKFFKVMWRDPAQGSLFKPSWAVRPTHLQPIIRRDHETGERVMSLMQWGLVPSWSKTGKMEWSALNARSETVATKPTFKAAFQKRRCLVPADAWYERQEGNDPKAKKQPWRLSLPDKPIIAMPGLWEGWQKPDGTWLHTYTIVTCEPAESIAFIHDRMPVIFRTEEEQRIWLDPESTPEQLQALLVPYKGKIAAHRVTVDVSNHRTPQGEHFAWPLNADGQPARPKGWEKWEEHGTHAAVFE